MGATFDERLKEAAEATEAALDRILSAEPQQGETARPERLLAAMRYASLGPGKRLRPFLVIETARLFGASGPPVIDAAAAIECLHAYSLVHDDLPAMDDDDLRRGRPTTHRAFDEATAILAGDALQALAFDTLARLDVEAAVRVELVAGLAAAAGLGGMVGGQMLDLLAESEQLDEAAVRRLQAMKTGALIAFSCVAGAILGAAHKDDRTRMTRFGGDLGLAFQVADDLIDATGEAVSAGKATAKDAARGKGTLVALRGVAGARALLDATIAAAVAGLAPYGEAADMLRDAARFVGERRR